MALSLRYLRSTPRETPSSKGRKLCQGLKTCMTKADILGFAADNIKPPPNCVIIIRNVCSKNAISIMCLLKIKKLQQVDLIQSFPNRSGR